MKTKNNNQLIRIINDPSLIKVGILAGVGFSNRLIEEKTGLSRGQIKSRLRFLRITRKMYRDGLSPVSRYTVQKSQIFAAHWVDKQLQEQKRLKD